jgi:dipeptidase
MHAGHPLRRIPGKEFAHGEKVFADWIELPQSRRTHTVLGSQPAGWWGFTHGLNEHGMAVGHTALRSRLRCCSPGLTGGDLVRLVLERCRSARQGVDCLTSLLERHGQCPPSGDPEWACNSVFLLADASEAFSIETAGRYWVCQEVALVKAASNVCMIRQDWDHISHGLAANAIAEGWWKGDGSKLDFAGALADCPVGESSGLRRWGRATLLLEQQSGHIDAGFLRRLLSDHYEGTHFEVDPLADRSGPLPICCHGSGRSDSGTTESLVAELAADPGRVNMAWCAFGSPCSSVFFPISMDGELPQPFVLGEKEPGQAFWQRHSRLADCLSHDVEHRHQVREAFGRLQMNFDQECEEFHAETATLRRQSDSARLRQTASQLMQHCLEEFEAAIDRLELAVSLSQTSRVTAK